MQHGEGREQHAHSGRDAKGVRVHSLYAAAVRTSSADILETYESL